MLADVRFLQNPYWVEALKPGSGLEPEIGAYIESDPAFAPFFKEFIKKVKSLIKEGDHNKTIAVGCTGGRHRSVYVVEKLARKLMAGNEDVVTEHRDLQR